MILDFTRKKRSRLHRLSEFFHFMSKLIVLINYEPNIPVVFRAFPKCSYYLLYCIYEGAHNIGKISCEFMEKRLYDFMGTGQPDPSIASDFLEEMRQNCRSDSNSNNSQSSRRQASEKSVTKMTMSYSHDLSSSIKSGSNFDTHYYNSLLRGRGLLFADQQLMYDKTTATLVGAYASDDGSTFRRDFARAMVKMSRIGVLTGSRGQIRLNCSTTN